MVLIDISAASELYGSIKEASLSGGSTVLILVAKDCDAVCACRILTTLLRTDNILYKVKPVDGHGDLAQCHREMVVDNAELRSVVLINCGGAIPLEDEFAVPHGVQLYLIDSHKPLHHRNIKSESMVQVLNDKQGLRLVDVPSDADIVLGVEEESEEESESDDSEDELDSFASRSVDGRPRKRRAGDGAKDRRAGRRRVVGSDSEGDGDDEGGGGFDDDGDEYGRDLELGDDPEGAASAAGAGAGAEGGRHAVRASAGGGSSGAQVTDRDARALGLAGMADDISRRRRKRLQKYYEGNYYGTPSCFLMFELTQQLNRDRNDLLWLAIVGTTHRYIEGFMSKAEYEALAADLNMAAVGLNEDGVRGRRTHDDGAVLAVSHTHGHIEAGQEFRFDLYRHWSLIESLANSRYVASKLRIWRDGGQDRLRTFLVKLGIPKAAYEQKYQFMSHSMKARLLQRCSDEEFMTSDEIQLPDIMYDSFTLQTGYGAPVSASDFACAVSALLECGGASLDGSGDGGGAGTGGSSSGATGDATGGTAGAGSPGGAGTGGGDSGSGADDSSPTWERNFSRAYDCLSMGRDDLLEAGIQRAMALQKAVLRQGTSLLETKSITNTGVFRYAMLNMLSGIDAELFTQPLALARLARFIVEVHQDIGMWTGNKARPLILCALNEARNTYLVLGWNVHHMREAVGKTGFFVAFDAAAKRINAHFSLESFDSHIMEIEQQEMTRFIESLHTTMTEEAEAQAEADAAAAEASAAAAAF